MLRVEKIKPEAWPEVLALFQEAGYESTLAYSRAAADRIASYLEFVVVRDAAGIIVAGGSVRIKTLPALGRGIAWMAAGPLLETSAGSDPATRLPEVLTALRQHYCESRGHILRVRLAGLSGVEKDAASVAAQNAGYAPTTAAPGYRSVAIDLSHDDETMMAGFQGKWRTDLRYALKSGLSVEKGQDAGLIDRFLALFADVQGAKGFRPEVPPELHFPLQGGDYAWSILLATKDGTDLAGIMVGIGGGNATYLYGATANAGRKLRAGYLLQWEAMRDARAAGSKWYDMGGIDEVGNPDVTRFKLRMNGRLLDAPGPFETHAGGVVPRVVLKLEELRKRVKGRRS